MLTKNQKCNISVFLMSAANILIFNFAWLITLIYKLISH